MALKFNDEYKYSSPKNDELCTTMKQYYSFSFTICFNKKVLIYCINFVLIGHRVIVELNINEFRLNVKKNQESFL